MKIMLAQIDAFVGNIDGNRQRAAEALDAASAQGADIVVLPELSLLGYPPDDLLLRPDLHERMDQSLAALAELTAQTDVAVIAGAPAWTADGLFNSAWVLAEGRVVGRADKRCLPNYGVFDEKRYFQAADSPCVVPVAGRQVGIMVCEDTWDAQPARELCHAGAEIIVSINASPYHWDKLSERKQVAGERVAETGLPLVYVNQVGGQDDLVFDGASFAIDGGGREALVLPAFKPANGVVTLGADGSLAGELPAAMQAPPVEEEPSVYGALVLGVRDYVTRNGFPGVFVGLSGGIDSALTLAIAVDALGPDAVTAVLMPSRYTAQMSLDDAIGEAQALGVRQRTLPISAVTAAFDETLADAFSGLPAGVTEENLQARTRGVLLMALSNKFNALVLATGNKSEMAVGYATLYGDMVGGFAPLKDVAKTRVYRLARWRNRQSPVIPQRVIDRPPSAELAEDQADSDSLPPYETLDPIMEALVEHDEAVEDIVARGFSADDVRQVARMLVNSEYKRRQAAPGPKISRRAFGRERRYPITSRFRF